MANELELKNQSTAPLVSPDGRPIDPETGKPKPGYHKSGCECFVCKKAAKARAEGKLSKKEKQALARARREKREGRKGALAASIETQVALGHQPNVALAARITGMNPVVAREVAKENNFVQTALSSAGISDQFLAELAKEGMNAFTQKIITDENGDIVDVVNMPDWRNRHAFWRDVLMAKKILGGETEFGGGSGGLIIITPDNAKVLPGHPPACTCDGCLRAWEDKTAHLRRAAIRERALLENTVNSARQDSRQDPRAKNAIDVDVIDAEETTEDEIETDDFGPIVG